MTSVPAAAFMAAFLALFVAPAFTAAQSLTYTKGQNVAPAYEGWEQAADGTRYFLFGYMNRNWEEELDVPIGPDNAVTVGGAGSIDQDQGQPTHFLPRRNRFVFRVKVPAGFTQKDELVWTLTTHGKTEKAYASLKTDYQIDNQVISTEIGGDFGSLRDELRYNLPPELEIQGEARRSVKVGEALTLVALAGDPDNLPARRDGKPQPRHPGKPGNEASDKPASPRAASASAAANVPNLVYRPPSSIVPSSGPGLRLSWIVYRGKAATVTFSPEQMKTWTDTRAWANSPWSPPFTIPEPPGDGRWVTEVRFQEPGTYVLRAVASDGSLFTYQNVTVTVTR